MIDKESRRPGFKTRFLQELSLPQKSGAKIGNGNPGWGKYLNKKINILICHFRGCFHY